MAGYPSVCGTDTSGTWSVKNVLKIDFSSTGHIPPSIWTKKKKKRGCRSNALTNSTISIRTISPPSKTFLLLKTGLSPTIDQRNKGNLLGLRADRLVHIVLVEQRPSSHYIRRLWDLNIQVCGASRSSIRRDAFDNQLFQTYTHWPHLPSSNVYAVCNHGNQDSETVKLYVSGIIVRLFTPIDPISAIIKIKWNRLRHWLHFIEQVIIIFKME